MSTFLALRGTKRQAWRFGLDMVDGVMDRPSRNGQTFRQWTDLQAMDRPSGNGQIFRRWTDYGSPQRSKAREHAAMADSPNGTAGRNRKRTRRGAGAQRNQAIVRCLAEERAQRAMGGARPYSP